MLVMIKLTSALSEILQSLLLVIIVFLSVYVISIDYFFISVILILAALILSTFTQKILVISSKGIRYVLKWELKWADIEACNLNKENGTLTIHVKDGENRQITSIKRKHYSVIENNIDNYLNSVQSV
jgi:Zn-dependent protease with chaperone function